MEEWFEIYGYIGSIHDLLDVLVVWLDVTTVMESWYDSNILDFGFYIGKGFAHAGFVAFSLVVSVNHWFVLRGSYTGSYSGSRKVS